MVASAVPSALTVISPYTKGPRSMVGVALRLANPSKPSLAADNARTRREIPIGDVANDAVFRGVGDNCVVSSMMEGRPGERVLVRSSSLSGLEGWLKLRCGGLPKLRLCRLSVSAVSR